MSRPKPDDITSRVLTSAHSPDLHPGFALSAMARMCNLAKIFGLRDNNLLEDRMTGGWADVECGTWSSYHPILQE